MSATNTGWIADAVTELGLRENTIASSPKLPTALGTRRTMDAGAAPTGGSGRATSRIGKALATLVFGSDADRHGNPDLTTESGRKARATIDRTRIAIDEQVKLGTASQVNIAGKTGNLSGNFFSAAGHNLADTGKPDLSRPVVLFLSGSGGTAEQYGTDIAEHYQGAGASVLSVNYSGYGGSAGGDPSEQSLLDDGQSMLQHLLDLGYQPDQIIMHGFSMGGAVAGVLQAHNEKNGTELRGLMLDRPMVSIGAATEAYALDAVQDLAGKKAGKALATLATPLAKGIAAITRKTCGSLSARKAVTALDSHTPVVVSGDEGRFEKNGADLRDELKKKFSKRSITGQASGADHLEADPMIDRNKADMQALIDTPPTQGGSGANLQLTAGLSDAQKTATRKLREKVEAGLAGIKDDIDSVNSNAKRYEDFLKDPGNTPATAIALYVTSQLNNMRTRTAGIAATINEFNRVSTSLGTTQALQLINQRKLLRALLQRIDKLAKDQGQAVTYDPARVRTELDYAAAALVSHATMSPTDSIAAYKKDQVIACNDSLKAMAAAGVTFAGPDLQLSMDVAAAARIIKPPPLLKASRRVRLDRTDSDPALDRRRAVVNLRSSYG